MDRLLSTTRVGEVLGINRRDVGQLIRDGKLRAVTQVIRGKGTKARRFVRESELSRYMADLDKPAREDEPEPARVRRPRGLRAELAAAAVYTRGE